MKLNIANLYRNFNESYSFRSKLSESGQKSISCSIVSNTYDTVSKYYQMIESCLMRERDESGKAKGSLTSQSELLYSPRLEHELICLVTSLLKAIPTMDIDKLLNQDPEITEEDKPILKEAYSALKAKINLLDQLLGHPCFARKKTEETPSNSN